MVFSLASIQKCIESYLQMRIFRLGDLFAVQIPLGGSLLGSLLRLILSACEHNFDKLVWPKIVARIGIKKAARPAHLATARDEDDVHICSHTFCPLCVEAAIKDIYDHEVSFDACDDHLTHAGGVATNKCLDMLVCLSATKHDIDIYH